MAARYVRIGQYPDYRDEIRGTLLEILASTANPGTYAAPEDVAGCTLEMGADGKWVGTLGSLSKATADALYASGALVNLATGATYRDTSGTQYTYSAGAGWMRSFAPVAGTVSSVNGRYAEAEDLGCVALWDFDEDDGDNFISKVGHPHELRNGVGSTVTVDTADGPVSGRSAVFNGSTDYLRLEAGKIGSLCVSAFGNNVTVIAIAKKTALDTIGFIAGVWQEDNNNPRRQYGLFLNLPAYGGANKVCGHVSKNGGASPNLPFSRDYSVNREQFLAGSWGCFAMSYDGAHARSYLYSRFESVPTYTEPEPPNGEGLTYAKNPYAFPLGLNNTNVGNFTAGATKLTSGYSNYFAGKIAAIAVFKRALSQAEITQVSAMLLRGKDTAPLIWYPFRWQDNNINTTPLSTVSVNKTYGLSVCTDWTEKTGYAGGFEAIKLTGTEPDSFLFVAEGTQPAFWFDEQAFGLPFSSIRKMTMLMNHTQPPTTLLYFCVRVSGTWWALGSGVSCASEHTSGADWSGAETGTLTMATSVAATRIDFRPGVALALTSDVQTVADIDDGVVDAIGLYNPTRDGTAGHPIRIRDLMVYA